MKRVVPAALLLCCAHSRARPALPPAPAARVEVVSETLFGTTVRDPYRWMEAQPPELTDWMRAQNARTRAVLDSNPSHAAMVARVHELSNGGSYPFQAQRYGDRLFYESLDSGSSDRKLYTRDASGRETVLVDPARMATPSATHFSLDWFVPSWDGRYVAYGISAGGSEDSTLRVVETATGRVLPDAIDRSQSAQVSWLPDSSGFFHCREQPRAAGASGMERYRRMKVYLHRLGDDADQALPLLGNGVPGSPPVGEYDYPSITVSPASHWVIAAAAHGVQNEGTFYAARIDELLAGSVRWKLVADVPQAVSGFDLRGDDAYLLTHAGASRFRIVRENLSRPDFARATEIVPQQKGVITALGVASDALYVQVLEGGPSRLLRAPFDGGPPADVALPFRGSISELSTNPLLPGALLRAQSYVDQPRILVAAGNSAADTGLAKPLGFDASPYETREELATSADGTQVPCTLIARRGLSTDGSHPALVEVYGAYGSALQPYFFPTRFAWLERSAVFVEAHARGGGEFGEDWHEAGRKETKQRTVDDFVACARLAVSQGWTSPAHLAGSGRSAGGIPLGLAITQTPQLFAAALDIVGATDPVRIEELASGPANVPEFGSARTEAGFKALFAMDSYLHVKDGVRYPAVMVETGVNDPRVAAWMPAKMAARLQAAQAGDRPILLRADFDAGHGLGSSREQVDLTQADEYTFLLWQLGDPAFQ